MRTHPYDWSEERIARLSLSCFPGFGSRSLRTIKEQVPGFKEAWLASSTILLRLGITSKAVRYFSDWRKDFDVTKLMNLLERESIEVFFPEDPDFPSALRTSSDPPEILFVRGKFSSAPAVAIVGTRKMTSYGKRCTEELVADLVGYGFVIVSGLALGVDATAHETALNAKGATLAFLGTGVENDSIYPSSNKRLAERIIQEAGAIATEFPPGTTGLKHHFPMRNRLIASYCAATVVIEAAEKSGSLITAKLALEENREVLAVPGPIWSQQSTGTNTLLKLGAKPCTRASDILEALALDRPELVAQARSELPLHPEEERLASLLDEPRHVDELSRLSGLPSYAVSSLLSVLELKGSAKRIGGQMWVKGRMNA